MEERLERVTREETLRTKTEKAKVWMPPEVLPLFENKIPGYKMRWVRYSLLGSADDANVLSRIRQGYEPVHPDELGSSGHHLPTMETGEHKGTVISGDLMLMKAPDEIIEQRNEYYSKRAKSMQGVVDQELEENDNDLAPISKSMKNSHSTGKPKVRDD